MVLGVDASGGMLRKAERRSNRAGWTQVHTQQASADRVNPDWIESVLGQPEVDGILCALGLTALPNWKATFDQMFSCLHTGGRFVLFDVYAEERTRATKSVELVARADLSRAVWQPLEDRCDEFERTVLPADVETFGGELYVAAGTKV